MGKGGEKAVTKEVIEEMHTLTLMSFRRLHHTLVRGREYILL